MTAICSFSVTGSKTTVMPMDAMPGSILIRFEERNGSTMCVSMSAVQLAAFGDQVAEMVARLNAPEPECSCVYVAADAVDARGCDAHAERMAA
jgi:hypothetical protein